MFKMLLWGLFVDGMCLIAPKTFKPIRGDLHRKLDESSAMLRAVDRAMDDDLERALSGTFPTYRHHVDQERARREHE